MEDSYEYLSRIIGQLDLFCSSKGNKTNVIVELAKFEVKKGNV
jgi:hypothetical protein